MPTSRPRSRSASRRFFEGANATFKHELPAEQLACPPASCFTAGSFPNNKVSTPNRPAPNSYPPPPIYLPRHSDSCWVLILYFWAAKTDLSLAFGLLETDWKNPPVEIMWSEKTKTNATKISLFWLLCWLTRIISTGIKYIHLIASGFCLCDHPFAFPRLNHTSDGNQSKNLSTVCLL